MTKHLPLALLTAAALSACGTIEIPTRVVETATRPAAAYRLDNNHWSDVAKIRAEANRLGTQISSGQITKVQAAQMLDRYRRSVAGRNSVDEIGRAHV